MENCIRAEWGYKSYFASYNSNSRGVAILFNNNLEFLVKKVYKDILGNYIFVTVTIMDREILIVGLYGPNRDDPEFYAELEERINDVGLENIIIGGGWNLVLDYTLDYYNYKHHNNIKAQEQVDNLMINLDLLDIWRELYPEMRRYTWRRNTPLQQSRLDFFLISDLLSTFVTNGDIKAGYRTDHSMITLTLTLGKESKNKLLWKFNNSLLKDKLFAEEINDVIKAVVEEYASLPYIREQLSKIPKCDIQFVISDQLFLDVLLMKIRSNTISYAAMKKRLNVAYKIGSACIAKRLKSVLPSLIKEDQTGFMASRYIGNNIRLIYDLISYLYRENKPGLLLCLDFEKAFDSVD